MKTQVIAMAAMALASSFAPAGAAVVYENGPPIPVREALT